MDITDVRVRKMKSDGKLKAYVTVTFDDTFVVHNIKVIEGKSGEFISMPIHRTKSGEFKDVAHPIHSDFRNRMKEMILDAYHKADEMTSFAADTPDEKEEESDDADKMTVESLL